MGAASAGACQGLRCFLSPAGVYWVVVEGSRRKGAKILTT